MQEKAIEELLLQKLGVSRHMAFMDIFNIAFRAGYEFGYKKACEEQDERNLFTDDMMSM